MTTDEQQTARYRKPDLSRAQPIRRLGGVLGRQAGQALEALESPELSPPPPIAAAVNEGSAVAEGVRAGYQVIEDYLRQGRESAAQARAETPPATAPVAASSPDKLTQRFFQYASDMTAVWLELMQATLLSSVPAAGASAREQGAGAGPFELRRTPPSTPAAVSSEPRRAATACAIRLRSARPVDARCELFDDAPHDVHVAELLPQDPTLPSLRGVTLGRDAQSGRLQLTLNIDHAQPVAAYSGLIVDRATHAPAGLVYVRLMDELA